jgi:transposase
MSKKSVVCSANINTKTTNANANTGANTGLSATCFIGFDVAKSKLDWSFINAQGIEQDYGTLPNKVDDIRELLFTLTGLYDNETFNCSVEATSTYHFPLLEACRLLNNLPCLVYNPILTKQQINGSVRGKKTDRSDAFLVARVGWSGGGRLHVPEPYMITKYYARSCQKLSAIGGSFQRYKNHFTELLDGKLTPDTIKALDNIQRSIKEAKKQMCKELVESAKGETFTRLQTIPGIGEYVAGSIIGELQDVSRFPKSKHLVAYAGLDTKIRQSGNALNSTGKLTKRGSSYLRHSLFIAANVARQHDEQFRGMYDKKRAEGKTYKEATCAVSRKMLKVVRSVWLNEKDYELPEEHKK